MKKPLSTSKLANALIDDECVVSLFLHMLSKNETVDARLLHKCIEANNRSMTLLKSCVAPKEANVRLQ